MSRLEEDLKQALAREEPGPQFTDRVMARIAASRAESRAEPAARRLGSWRRLAQFFQPVRTRWALAGAALCLSGIVAYGAYRYYEYQRQQQALVEMAEGEKAKQQVMLALRIAGAKLNVAQRKVLESSQKKTEMRGNL
ncbi:MAG TPA: hypothetical protein VJ302_34065 [Blastocatellia bacterium]|nr:hypothetical protein [Blastocatellia bacterium]